MFLEIRILLCLQERNSLSAAVLGSSAGHSVTVSGSPGPPPRWLAGGGLPEDSAEIQDRERMQSNISERKRQAGTGWGPGVSFQSPSSHTTCQAPPPATSQQVLSSPEPSRYAAPGAFAGGGSHRHLCLGKVPEPQRKCSTGRSLTRHRHLEAARPSPRTLPGAPAQGQPRGQPS